MRLEENRKHVLVYMNTYECKNLDLHNNVSPPTEERLE